MTEEAAATEAVEELDLEGKILKIHIMKPDNVTNRTGGGFKSD